MYVLQSDTAEHSDLASTLAELQSFQGGGWKSCLPTLFLAVLSDNLSLQELTMLPMDWGKDKSPAREPKKVGRLVIHLDFTFSSVETLSQVEIFHALGARQIGDSRIKDMEVQLSYHLFTVFKISLCP